MHEYTKVFLLAAKKAGISPENCIIVEDAVSGIQAAVAAGMISVGAGAARECGLAEYGIDSLDGLIDIIME